MKIVSLQNQTTALRENCNKIMAVCVSFFPFCLTVQLQGQHKKSQSSSLCNRRNWGGGGGGVGGRRDKKIETKRGVLGSPPFSSHFFSFPHPPPPPLITPATQAKTSNCHSVNFLGSWIFFDPAVSKSSESSNCLLTKSQFLLLLKRRFSALISLAFLSFRTTLNTFALLSAVFLDFAF